MTPAPLVARVVLGAALLAAAASRAESKAAPVKRIDISVEPYYAAARAPGETPKVKVWPDFDAKLASDKIEDIAAVRDVIIAHPETVTPMTLMVLAVRFYDVGLPDEAVFWFYAAKDRYTTLSEVVDIEKAKLEDAEEAIRDFATFSAPVISGYAFCDLAKQREARAKAAAWVEKNPYQPVFMEQLTALPGKREDNLKKSVARIKALAESERRHLASPQGLKKLMDARKHREDDKKYCWKRKAGGA